MKCYRLCLNQRIKRTRVIFLLCIILIFVSISTMKEAICLTLFNTSETINRYTYNDTIGRTDLCVSSGLLPKIGHANKHSHIEDIFKLGPFDFLPNFKNPCWWHMNVTYGTLRCLHYFFIIGSPKCGTTDVWSKLMKHPNIAKPKYKEAWWLVRNRLRSKQFIVYVRENYQGAAYTIASNTINISKHGKDAPYHHMITGEGTVDTIFDNHLWPLQPGNENCSEPKYTNADYLKHLYPDIKLIVILRNPVERVFSDFLYEAQFLGYNKTAEVFQHAVKESLLRVRKCRENYTIRACMYNHTLETYKARMQIGMYHLYLKDWFRVFPRHQFHIVRLDDLKKNATDVYKQLFSFLKIKKLNQEEINKILEAPIKNSKSKRDKSVHMNNSTKLILHDFYRTHNEDLALLLGNKQYLEWNIIR